MRGYEFFPRKILQQPSNSNLGPEICRPVSLLNAPIERMSQMPNLTAPSKIRKFNVLNPSDKSEYVYFGIACHLIKIVNVALHKLDVLFLKINVDGMTPFKSSPLNFWPILGLVHHEYASYKPFVIAAYYGKGKPFSVNLYLDEFIKELNCLCQNGITIGERKFEVRVKCFCCDRPARAFLKKIVNHGAYYACERCWVSGFYYLNRIVYPLRDCKLRTDESFRRKENPEHHDGESPLLQLKDKDNESLDMILLFMQEFMHAGPLGIMKKLLTEQWFSDKTKITREKMMFVSLRLVNLASQIPKELHGTTRDLHKLSLWKAKEFRLFLLYCGPFVLEGILTEEEYNHFMLLHVACRILHSRDLLQVFGEHTKMLLNRFVSLCELMYGLEFVVLNPHILSHIYDDVVNMGCPINELDAFIFEGYLSELKFSIRSGNKPLAQVCRKIETDFILNNKKVVSTLDLLILKAKKDGDEYHVSNLEYLNFELTLKNPDNIILTTDGSIIQIQDLVCSSLDTDASKLYVLGEKMEIIGPAYNYPVSSSALHTFSMVFCLIELAKIKDEPAWDESLVVVPFAFMLPKVQGCETGASSVLYPSMPHCLNTKDMIKDFTDRKATPPESWGAKECVIKNVTIKKKRSNPSQEGKKLNPTASNAKNIKRTKLQKKNESDPTPAKADQIQVLSDVSNITGTEPQRLQLSMFATSPEAINDEPPENSPTTQLKEQLFQMPEALASCDLSLPIPSGHSSLEDVSNMTEIVSPALGEAEIDFSTFDTTESNETPNASIEQANVTHEDELNFLCTKNDLLDNMNKILAHIDLKLPQIVGRVVDHKVTPRLDDFGSKLGEIMAFAESHAENKDILTFDGFTKLYDFSLKLPTLNEFTRFEAAIQGKNLDDKVNAKYSDFRSNLIKHINTTSNTEVTPYDNCRAIMRRFFKDELICNFTATRSKGNKPIFKHTGFFSCMLDALLPIHNRNGKQILDESCLASHVGDLINLTKTRTRSTIPIQQGDENNASGSTVPNTDLMTE
ncbi:hypothetical protein QAD02_020622 [Eretmocerus hayati]|uniref:Uncharacterized protein n=1 Tax=Eretmocerus hayati TaxID=131215 RepID=A0ACC2PQF5_9HYME|nr:hypothetical protein QAD02_020622 [Eretmocerus hayati]